MESSFLGLSWLTRSASHPYERLPQWKSLMGHQVMQVMQVGGTEEQRGEEHGAGGAVAA